MTVTQFKIGDLVSVIDLKNARGFPLCGEIVEIDNDNRVANVDAYGIPGPGARRIITDVPFDKLRVADKP